MSVLSSVLRVLLPCCFFSFHLGLPIHFRVASRSMIQLTISLIFFLSAQGPSRGARQLDMAPRESHHSAS